MVDKKETEKRSRGRPGFEQPVRIPLLAEKSDRDLIDAGAAAAGMSRSAFMVHHAKLAAAGVLGGKGD